MKLTIEQVHADHYNKVSNWTRNVIKNREDAEEVTSDVFMKLNKNLSNYDSNKSSLYTWIFNITKNAIIDYWRTKKNITISISDLIGDDDSKKEMIDKIYTYKVTPESELINNELGEAINNAIESLPMNYKNIAELFLVEQKSYDEICSTLDLPLGTVKGTISRAKEMLRIRLNNL